MGDVIPRRIAAVDIGSNSIHLTAAEVSHERITVLRKEKVNARLGFALDTRLRLPHATIQGAISTLVRYRDLCNELKAEMRVGATAALRKSKNKDEFISAAAEHGITIVLIDDIHEARLVRAGALFGLPSLFDTRSLCIDVGGGSTEISMGRAGSVFAATSLPIGGLTIQGRLGLDPISSVRLRTERSNLLRRFKRSLKSFKHLQFDRVIATGGTIQRLARLVNAHRGDPLDDIDGKVIHRIAIRDLVQRLMKCRSNADRLLLPGMDHDRADVLLGGTLIFHMLGDALDIDEWIVSMSAMRTGILITPSWPQ